MVPAAVEDVATSTKVAVEAERDGAGREEEGAGKEDGGAHVDIERERRDWGGRAGL